MKILFKNKHFNWMLTVVGYLTFFDCQDCSKALFEPLLPLKIKSPFAFPSSCTMVSQLNIEINEKMIKSAQIFIFVSNLQLV